MELTNPQWVGLGVALNEADFCDLRINEKTGEVRLLFVVLTLPVSGPEPSDCRRVLSLKGVSRIFASFRIKKPEGDYSVRALRLRDLPGTVRSYGCQPVSGWDFFEQPAPPFEEAARLASIDVRTGRGDGRHSVDLALSSKDPATTFELRLEFDELAISDSDEREIMLHEFIEGGRRWWAALREGDPRVGGHGITFSGE